MSERFSRFNQNISRVDALVTLYGQKKGGATRPSVVEADILRAAVVFLHSALEDYLRGVISSRLAESKDKSVLDKIALKGSEHRAEKFLLGALVDFSDISVSELITDSVHQYMSKVSFNDINDICNWVKTINLNIEGFQEHESISKMIARRHKIVHEADMNEAHGYGYHRASSISVPIVTAWKEAVVNLVKIIDGQLNAS